MSYYLYILKSKNFDRNYIGVTSDLVKRLHRHNSGQVKSTKSYRPWDIIHIEEFEDKSLAYKREYFLKHPKGYIEKIKICGRFA